MIRILFTLLLTVIACSVITTIIMQRAITLAHKKINKLKLKIKLMHTYAVSLSGKHDKLSEKLKKLIDKKLSEREREIGIEHVPKNTASNIDPPLDFIVSEPCTAKEIVEIPDTVKVTEDNTMAELFQTEHGALTAEEIVEKINNNPTNMTFTHNGKKCNCRVIDNGSIEHDLPCENIKIIPDEDNGDTNSWGSTAVNVEVCKSCIENTKEDVRSDMQEKIDELEQQVEELESELESGE